jgi:hypothetical protein
MMPGELDLCRLFTCSSVYGCNEKETRIRNTTGEIIKGKKKEKAKKEKAPENNEQV